MVPKDQPGQETKTISRARRLALPLMIPNRELPVTPLVKRNEAGLCLTGKYTSPNSDLHTQPLR